MASLGGVNFLSPLKGLYLGVMSLGASEKRGARNVPLDKIGF